MSLTRNGITSRPPCRWIARLRGPAMIGLVMGALAGSLAVAAQTAVPAQAAAPASVGTAHIWIYRSDEVYQSVAAPYIRLNGTIVGVSRPGAVLSLAVPPGTYAVTVDSTGSDDGQYATVAVAGGQQAFIKVLSAQYTSGGQDAGSGYGRDTFYTWQIAPPVATAEIARLPGYRGG